MTLDEYIAYLQTLSEQGKGHYKMQEAMTAENITKDSVSVFDYLETIMI